MRDVSVWWIQLFEFETFDASYIVASRRFLAACWLLFAGALTIVSTSRTARSRAGFLVLLALMFSKFFYTQSLTSIARDEGDPSIKHRAVSILFGVRF